MRKLFAAIALALSLCGAASAQSVQQSGNVTAGHVATWVTTGIIKDGGAVTANASLSGGSTTSITSGQTFYCVTSGCNSSAAIAALVPFTATAVNLNVAVGVAPGVGQTITATLMVGPYGTLAATSLTCTISGTNTTCSDPTDQVNIAAGQAWAVRLVSSGSAASTTGEGFAVQLISTGPPQPTSPYVLQSGNITSGHQVIWTTNGVVQDGGVPVNNTIAPGPFTAGDLVYVNSLLQLADSGIAATSLVTGPGSAVSGNLPSFNGTTGKVFQDSGIASAAVVQGPSLVVAGNLASFNGTGGRLIQDSGVTSVTTGSGLLVLQTSPSLLGTPTAPTAANGTNTTQVATTAFVQNQIAAQCPTAGAFLVGIGGSSAQCTNVAFTGGLTVTLNAQAGFFAGFIAQDGGTNKWAFGKKSDNTFQIRDVANSVDIINVKAGGPVTIVNSSLAVCDSNTTNANIAIFCQGSNANPVGTINLALGISRVNAATSGSGPDASLWINTVLTAANTKGGNGLFSQMLQNGTGDAVAIIGLSQYAGSGSHSSFGAYFEGNKSAGAGAGAFVIQASVDNTVANDSWTVSSVFNLPSSVGIDMVCGGGAQLVGTKNCTAAYSVRSAGATTLFDVGLGFQQLSVVTATIEDDSSSVTVFKVTGTHTTGIDFGSATISGNLLSNSAFSISNTGLITTVGSIGSTSTDRLLIENVTAATSGQQQWSPRIHWLGQGWKTNATAASQTLDWIAELQSVAGAAQPQSTLVFSSQINGGGYVASFAMQIGQNNNTAFLVNSASAKNANVIWQDNAASVWYLGNQGGSSDALSLLNSDVNSNTQVARFFQSGGVVIGTSTTDPGAAILALGTALQSPLVKGGTAAGSTLELRSTSGTGSGDAVLITGGTNGGTTLAEFFGSAGKITFGNGNTPNNTTFLFSGSSTVVNGSNGEGPAFVQLTAADGTNARLTLNTFGTAVNGKIVATAARGTAASPTALVANDGVFGFAGYAYDGTNWDLDGAFNINVTAVTANTNVSGGIRILAVNAGAAKFSWFTPLGGLMLQSIANYSSTNDPGQEGLFANGQMYAPNLTQTSAAQTGTVCWSSGSSPAGKFTVDTTVACLTSLEEAKDILSYRIPWIALLDRLDPFSFRYRHGWGDNGQYEQFGLGARQVASVDERMVGRDFDGNLHGVRYQELTAVLVGSMKQIIEACDAAANDNFCVELRKRVGR